MVSPPSLTGVQVENVEFPPTAKPPGSTKTLFLGGAGARGLEIQGKFVKFTAIGVYLEDTAVPSLAVKWKGKSAEELTESVEFFRDIVTAASRFRPLHLSSGISVPAAPLHLGSRSSSPSRFRQLHLSSGVSVPAAYGPSRFRQLLSPFVTPSAGLLSPSAATSSPPSPPRPISSWLPPTDRAASFSAPDPLYSTSSARCLFQYDAAPEFLSCLRRDPFDSRHFCAIEGPFEKFTRVTMILPLTGQQYSEKVSENCVAFWKSVGVYTDAEAKAIEKFLEVFKDEKFPPGASILFTQSPNGSLTIGFSKDGSIPEIGNAVIENKLLSEAVLESIIGKHGVSPAAKQSLAARSSELLKENDDKVAENGKSEIEKATE